MVCGQGGWPSFDGYARLRMVRARSSTGGSIMWPLYTVTDLLVLLRWPRGPSDVGIGGGEALVGHSDLAGVYAELAAEAESDRVIQIRAELRVVREAGSDAVEGSGASAGCGGEHEW
jgi:hypothetical protein